jgi:hypothetical protein
VKRTLGILGAALVAGLALGAWHGSASAQESARVRVVHASPDAPAVDVYADGARVLTAVPYKGSSEYLPVPAGDHNFQVFATGANPESDEPVIDADATLVGGQDYTIAAVGTVAEIRPLVLEDNNAAPASGKAHVRVVHASPDAPAVDVAVKGGPVLFSDLAFPSADGPSPVDAGTYDLEVRPTGTTTVALPIDDVALQAGKIYTVFAVGLLNGTPALEALPIVNDPAMTSPAPSAGSGGAAPAPTAAAGTLPASGSGVTADDNGILVMISVLGIVGLLAGGAAFAVARSRA